MGDVPSLLIDKSNLNIINVAPLNLSLFALLLTYTDQSEWLSDPRVNLIQPEQYQLAENYLAIAADLVLADEHNCVIRDFLVMENNREFINSVHSANDREIEELHKLNLEALNRDPSAEHIKLNTKNNTKASIIASGPTLEVHYEALKKQRNLPPQERPTMIVVDTALVALTSQGIIPDIVVTLDKNITLQHFPEKLPSDTSLVYFPHSNPDVINSWKGKKFNAYSNRPIFDECHKNSPKIRLYTNGSVIHPTVDLAVQLGLQEISLYGCDFSYPHNKTHAYWQDGVLGPSINLKKNHWVLNGHNQRVPTDLNFRAYLRYLEIYILAKPEIKFYQSSKLGAKIAGTHYRD
ncbi:motility associated factor glycosyltransferase family protein [Shewanella donghaensis]|uniref:motility associated factor glycosyltransferase family protein n=1 Tax=Shewanella donghaensis TaxID=238836 RepID=UPI001D058EF5|nr:6-hydroxymethylpterin diphosphokinase MptE-like protein [Shewanella donghaensis]